MTTVLLVDDHAVVREGYKRLLERSPDLAVAGEAASAAEAYRAFCTLAPDITVMDISLPDVSGIEALRRLLARAPEAKVLMFSIHEEAIYAERALAAGARGYLTKASAPELLVDAIRAVLRGDVFVSPDVRDALAARVESRAHDALASLSTREFEIARLIVSGLSVREIAERLCLTYKTVANYQTAIRQKLGATTPARLMQIAARGGLASTDEPRRWQGEATEQ